MYFFFHMYKMLMSVMLVSPSVNNTATTHMGRSIVTARRGSSSTRMAGHVQVWTVPLLLPEGVPAQPGWMVMFRYGLFHCSGGGSKLNQDGWSCSGMDCFIVQEGVQLNQDGWSLTGVDCTIVTTSRGSSSTIIWIWILNCYCQPTQLCRLVVYSIETVRKDLSSIRII